MLPPHLKEMGVHVLPGHEKLPDMVFTANQSFPFLSANGGKSVLLSRMHSDFRKPEVTYFQKWYEQAGYKVYSLNAPTAFEGNGDALIHLPYGFIWGGYGHRTAKETYSEMSERFGLDVIPLHLTRPEYYHLDTCFSILDEKTVVIQESAFEPVGLKLIYEVFSKVINVEGEENLSHFCCNCHSPDGKRVILHHGAKRFRSDLEKAGFEPVEVNTSEFIKSGGSVFCMKMMVW
jgi:N-dimethylarginine dimethylaminohydrolase